jgi:hypothetical protein
MSSSPGRRMKIGDFLLRRLEEAGVRHLFGVPGDYNLELLQQLQDNGTLKWIGTCSELNASYAADGYARLNGLGALLVTNGVGALSAINGVGGSYSEHVPVICIAGSIPLRSIDRGLGMHHTMADGTYDHFLDAYAHVTTAHARLTPRNATTDRQADPRRVAGEASSVHGATLRHRLPRYRGSSGSAHACLPAQRPGAAAFVHRRYHGATGGRQSAGDLGGYRC